MPANAQTSSQAFLDRANARFEALSNDPRFSQLLNLNTGSSGFLPLNQLIRGQDEVSVDNMLFKLGERQAAGDVKPDSIDGKWLLSYDLGLSSVPANDPITVIKTKSGYVIADGHHDVYLALYLGGTTIAAHVIDDLSNLSSTELWTQLKKRNLVYLRESVEQLALQPPLFANIRDNPNRYLASLIALKVAGTLKPGAFEVTAIKGAKNPAWIKVNDGIPFIEFYIARVLSAAGIKYDPRWGKDIPDEILELSRQALLSAAASGKFPEISATPVIEDKKAAAYLRKDPIAAAKFIFTSQSGNCRSVFNP